MRRRRMRRQPPRGHARLALAVGALVICALVGVGLASFLPGEHPAAADAAGGGGSRAARALPRRAGGEQIAGRDEHPAADGRSPAAAAFHKAGRAALGGGLPGAAAQVVQVLTLMWMRTIVQYQYRHGVNMADAARALYDDGGPGRFYSGLGPALLFAPAARFADTAANAFVLSLCAGSAAPVVLKTAAASALAGAARALLMPLDTWKVALQVHGAKGPGMLRARLARQGPAALYEGAAASILGSFTGHLPWFTVHNVLSAMLPPFPHSLPRQLLRSATIGFAASVVSDTCANSLRVLKCYKQTALAPVSYAGAVAAIVRQDGLRGLLFRGLSTKLLSNAVQSIVFSVVWRVLQDAWAGPPPPPADGAVAGAGQGGAGGAAIEAGAGPVVEAGVGAEARAGAVELALPPARVPAPVGRGDVLDPLGFVTLAGGLRMPRVGFGTAGLGEATAAAVGWALAAGYRLLDSAQAREWYREDLVGQAWLASGLPRSSIWITTKVHPKHLGYQATLTAFDSSARDLGTDYVDLVLLHYPECWPGLPGCAEGEPASGPGQQQDWRGSWRALRELRRRGRARAIGVSNFSGQQLRELLALDAAAAAASGEKPADGGGAGAEGDAGAPGGVGSSRVAVLQTRSDPLAQARPLQAACARAGVAFQAYSSLGTQHAPRETPLGSRTNPVLSAPAVAEAAAARGVTPGQVVLRWALARGQAVIPRSATKGHIEANRQLGFDLTEAELAAIDALDEERPA